MKDLTKEELESGRPSVDVSYGIDFCLDMIYSDKTKYISDRVVDGLSFEELIGVLLLARDSVNLE